MRLVNRKPMASPDWLGSVRSAIITMESGWVMPNPSPKTARMTANDTAENIDGISPTPRVTANMDTAMIFLRSNN